MSEYLNEKLYNLVYWIVLLLSAARGTIITNIRGHFLSPISLSNVRFPHVYPTRSTSSAFLPRVYLCSHSGTLSSCVFPCVHFSLGLSMSFTSTFASMAGITWTPRHVFFPSKKQRVVSFISLQNEANNVSTTQRWTKFRQHKLLQWSISCFYKLYAHNWKG